MDASVIVEKAGKAFEEKGVPENLHHKRYPGGHVITEERFEFIIKWLVGNA
jgi:predicted esterase